MSSPFTKRKYPGTIEVFFSFEENDFLLQKLHKIKITTTYTHPPTFLGLYKERQYQRKKYMKTKFMTVTQVPGPLPLVLHLEKLPKENKNQVKDGPI